MHTFGIIGLGLIGGSLAAALKKSDPECRILAGNRTKTVLEKALEEGLIDEAVSGPEDKALSACDAVFLCAPAGANIEALQLLKGNVSQSCLLTDVGSVKTPIHEAARSLGLTRQFIGGHPMAGSEKSGLSNATDHMFENAYFILTPEKDVPQEMIEAYKKLVRSFQALPLVLSCEEHDYVTAAVSHLPHVIASALVNTVHDLDSEQEHMKQIAAGGFKDITRIASSSPEMWEHICLQNNANIARVMDTFLDQMLLARERILSGDGSYIYDMFDRSGAYRSSFEEPSYGSLKKVHRIYCDIIDEAGAIATIATILAVGGISIKNIMILHNREFEEGVLRIEFYDHESAAKAAGLLRHHRYTVWDK